MRSPAGATAFGRSSDLLDQVDYRLAQTPEEKEEIYNLRYRAYLREGAVKESPAQRVTDQYDDLPNSWTFGVHLFGELYSSVRISVRRGDGNTVVLWTSSETQAAGFQIKPGEHPVVPLMLRDTARTAAICLSGVTLSRIQNPRPCVPAIRSAHLHDSSSLICRSRTEIAGML